MQIINVFPAKDAIKAALDSIQEGSEEVTINLESGTYSEILSYNKKNPLIIQAKDGVSAKDCILAAENCEAFHKDTENRSVFVFGPDCTNVTLKGFTIENTHIKTKPAVALANQAEALCWHNRTGFLYAENMRFISRQDTIHVKGFSYFNKCFITGDVDYIWGYCHTCLLEDCLIHTREDNLGDRDAYVLQSRALNSAPGFIFKKCKFTADKRLNSKIYIGRSSGTGSENSVERWDSIALIDCIVSSDYDEAFYTDENGERNVYPAGSAQSGWREYGTKILLPDGTLHNASTSKRYKMNYSLSEQEYHQFYDDSAIESLKEKLASKKQN